MGWLTDLTTWGKKIWRHDTTAVTANYAYQTIEYAFEQIAALPRVVRSVVVHPPTRTVAAHLLYITVTDLMSLMLVSYLNEQVQQYGRTYLNDPPDDAWLSPDTAIHTGLSLLSVGAWAIGVNRKLELLTRMTIVNIEASPMLTGVKTITPLSSCVDNCPMSLKGPISNLTGFWAAEAFIHLVGYIPIAGAPLAILLDVYHSGHYVLTLAMPDLCNDHLAIYFREHSELAFSLGLGPVGSQWFVNSLTDTSSNIPWGFYAGAIKQLMIVAQVSVAAHMTLPQPQKASVRARNPVLFLQDGVDVTVEILLLGLQKKIPRMLVGRQPGSIKDLVRNLPWGTIFELSMQLRHNKLARIFLPFLLRDAQSFVRDAITSSSWPTVQASIVDVLKTMADLHQHPAVRAVSTMPNVASALVETIFGTPKFATKLLLQLITDPEVINLMRTWRHEIEKLQVDTATAVPVSNSPVLLSGQTSAANAESHLLLANSTLAAPDTVIRRAPTSTSLPPAQTIIRRSAGSAVASAGVAPERIIRHRFHAPKPSSVTSNHAEFDDLGDDWVQVDDATAAELEHPFDKARKLEAFF